MTGYLEFVLITSYMAITYHVIALKYRRSRGFLYSSPASRTFQVLLHIFIVITNIILYLLLISKDFSSVHIVFRITGILVFCSGLFMIFWGMYSLRKGVFVPGKKLIVTGPFAIVRHPMYLGGIAGASGLAIFAGSLQGLLYSFILGAVLHHIAKAEEEDLEARLGQEYTDYMRKVPKLLPCMTWDKK
ncbi:MAG: isoprenylcysteine carboxylmethyltransferase family protein [Candidatus Methanoperedens sp.]|nr:isoprenylcysteine carboxylmethyltransferase family protein [Candidatus Methanoperedens sp.]